MLNRKSIERALAKYVAHKDPEVLERLTAFGPMLLKAADLSKQLNADIVTPTDEDLVQVWEHGETLLPRYPVQISPEQFVGVAQELAATLLGALQLEGQIEEACARVDWSAYAAPEMLALAGKNPIEYFEQCEKAAQDVDFFEFFVLPVLTYTVRVFLDPVATEWSREIARLAEEEPRHNRPVHCPVCGTEAAIASVTETSANGNRKKLHCTCCGASWLFERIRCAHCGNTAVSDFQYVHDEDDDTHRLHVCKACGEATSTVFAGEDLNFNADVEQIVMTGLELFYEASRDEAKTAQ
jgi:FdhE protein